MSDFFNDWLCVRVGESVCVFSHERRRHLLATHTHLRTVTGISPLEELCAQAILKHRINYQAEENLPSALKEFIASLKW